MTAGGGRRAGGALAAAACAIVTALVSLAAAGGREAMTGTQAMPDTCAAALDRVRSWDLRGWHGWPEDCTRAAVEERLGAPNPGEGRGFLGTERREHSYQTFAVKGAEEPVRVWSADGRPVMLDVEYPTLAVGWKDAASAWGEPDARLDFDWGHTPIQGGEWVWARRGVTVFINPANDALLRVALYRPVALDDYRRGWRLNLASRRFPPPADL